MGGHRQLSRGKGVSPTVSANKGLKQTEWGCGGPGHHHLQKRERQLAVVVRKRSHRRLVLGDYTNKQLA